MNSRSNALAISALIMTILEEAKTSIDEETQFVIKKILSTIDEVSSEIQKNAIGKTLDMLRACKRMTPHFKNIRYSPSAA